MADKIDLEELRRLSAETGFSFRTSKFWIYRQLAPKKVDFCKVLY